MTRSTNLLDLAIQYHDALPKRIREYLRSRGIPDEIIDSHLLGWNGWRITIPIYNRQGEVVYFRQAKDPQDSRPAPKIRSSPGSSVELYGWDQVLKRPPQIVICEGEFDRLVLEAQGFPAVTSTGGAATFRPQWADELKTIDDVYVCFDRDQAGQNGAKVVALMIPQAKLVELPAEVGQGGDVTDFFVRLGRSREEFIKLMQAAKPVPEIYQFARPVSAPRMHSMNSLLNERIQRIKSEIPIEKVAAEYTQLRSSGANKLIGRCPFHNDRVPSMVLYLPSRTYHCYGCGAHGDVINFVRAMENLSFAQTLDALETFLSPDGKRHKDNNSKRQAA